LGLIINKKGEEGKKDKRKQSKQYDGKKAGAGTIEMRGGKKDDASEIKKRE
jgi:hypothetical protein